jgi:hypothetical protein
MASWDADVDVIAIRARTNAVARRISAIEATFGAEVTQSTAQIVLDGDGLRLQ